MTLPTFSEAYKLSYKDLMPIYESIGSERHNLLDYLNYRILHFRDMFLDGDIQTHIIPFKNFTQNKHEFVFKKGCKIKILRNTEEQTRGIVLDNNYMFFNYNMRFKIR